MAQELVWIANRASESESAGQSASEPYLKVNKETLVWHPDKHAFSSKTNPKQEWPSDQVFAVAREQPEQCHDLTGMRTMDLPNTLHVLKQRWQAGITYTCMNDMWISVNPYQSVSVPVPVPVPLPLPNSGTWSSPSPPTMIGGCGFWTGFGHCQTGSKLTRSPWNSASSFVHSSFIASICSRISRQRRENFVP